MSIKSELKDLLKDSYTVINELQKVADMGIVKKELMKQSHQTINRLEVLNTYLHRIVDSFDLRARDIVDTVTSCKIKTLDSHSVELLQCLEYLSKMCVITEDLLKLQEDSAEVLGFAPKLKQELSSGLRDCSELSQIDYNMFTSLDLEIDKSWLFKKPFLSIISKSSHNTSKLCCVGFEDVEGSMKFKGQMPKDAKSFETDSGNESPTHERETKCETDHLSQQSTLTTILEEFEEQMDTSSFKPELNETNTELKACFTQPHQYEVCQSEVLNIQEDVTLEEDLLASSLEALNLVNEKENDPGSGNKAIFSYKNQSEHCASVKGHGLSCIDVGAPQSLSRSEKNNFSERLEENILPASAVSSHNDSDVAASKNNFSLVRNESLAVNDPEEICASNEFEKIQILPNVIIASEKRRNENLIDTVSYQAQEEASMVETTQTIEKIQSLTLKKAPAAGLLKDKPQLSHKSQDKLTPQLIKLPHSNASTVFQQKDGSKDVICHVEEPVKSPQFSVGILGYESNVVTCRSESTDNHDGAVGTYPSKRYEKANSNRQARKENSENEEQKDKGQLPSTQKFHNLSPNSSRPTTAPFMKQVFLESQFSSATGKPLDMFFNIESVITQNRHGVAEINAVFKEKITGGSNTYFEFPIGCCLMKTGRIVVADTGNHTVKILQGNDLQRTIGKNDGITFVRPSAVVVDSNDNIYIKDDLCVQIFNSEGRHLKTVGMKIFKYPYGIALTEVPPRGPTLFVLDAMFGRPKLHRYLIKEDKLQSCEYEPLVYFGSARSKLRFFAIHNDKILASDLGASTMYISNLYGQFLLKFGNLGYQNGEFVEPSGVAADADGHWLVADSRNNRVQVFTNDGEFMAHIKFSQPIRRPSGIHLSSNGTLYVINYLDQCIKVYSLTT